MQKSDLAIDFSQLFKIKDFTYNKEADSITQSGSGQTATINDVKISFENDRIKTLAYSYLNETALMTYSYETVTIDIPANS